MHLLHVGMGIVTAVLLVACGRSSEADKPLLEEAARYHQEATKIQEAVEPQIKQIDSLKAVLSRSGTPLAQTTAATLDSLKTAFEEWEDNLVEVPGMEAHNHRHGDHEHHHHHDATVKDLPADQMRDLQRELLANIRRIQQQLDATRAQVR